MIYIVHRVRQMYVPNNRQQRRRQPKKWNDSKVMFRLVFFLSSSNISHAYIVYITVYADKESQKKTQWKLMCVKFEENAKHWWKTNRSPFRRCPSFWSFSVSMKIHKTGKISLFHFEKKPQRKNEKRTNEWTIIEWILHEWWMACGGARLFHIQYVEAPQLTRLQWNDTFFSLLSLLVVSHATEIKY